MSRLVMLFGMQPRFKLTAPGKAIMSCPGPLHKHGDRHPSLSAGETADGVILLKCWAGCETREILLAMNLEFADLYPTPAHFHLPKPARPFSAADALIGLALESLVLRQFANQLAAGTPLTEADRDRLLLSATRIQRAQEATQ